MSFSIEKVWIWFWFNLAVREIFYLGSCVSFMLLLRLVVVM